MFHVERPYDVGEGTVPMGKADDVAGLHTLLTNLPLGHRYRVTSDKTDRVVRVNLEAPINDLEFSRRIVEVLSRPGDQSAAA